MTDFVELYWKRNRGWPWPDDSWGLTPMFGENGWCHSCGVPRHPQSGSIILRRKSMKVEGAWVPNWQFDVICLAHDLMIEVTSRFDIETREVGWHPSSPGEATQIIVPTIGDAWFDEEELRTSAIAHHGVDGKACVECGVWRWMPLNFDILPPRRITPPLGDVAIAASPEWFGDGKKAFRQILVRRELAELIVAASPRDFKVHEVN